MKAHFGPFVFDLSNQLLWRGSQEVPLPPRVLGVLGLLVARPGVVVSRQELIETVWKDAFVSDTSLAEAISFLRQALGDDPQQPSYIQTVHRRGYRFLHPAEPAAPDAPPAERAVRDPWAQLLPWAIAFLLAAMTASALWRLAHPDTPVLLPVTRFEVGLPPGTSLDVSSPAIALSGDGAHLAFVACGPDGCRLFLRAMDETRAQPIAGTEGAAAPFFSPDNGWIGLFADGKLKKIAIGGGVPVTIADARHPFGAAWLDDGTIVFASKLTGGMQRVAAAGGPPRSATEIDARIGELRHAWPERVPGSRFVLMTALLTPGAPPRSRIVAVSLDTGQRTVVVDHASAPRFVAPNALTFVRGGDLMAAAFDPSQLKLVGQPVTVASRIGEEPAQYAVSRVGSLAVAGPASEAASQLAWVGTDGIPSPLSDAVQHLPAADLSTDGRRIVAVKDDDRDDLWWADVERGVLSRVTFEGEHRDPRWTVDGRAIAFASRPSGVFNLFVRSVDENLAARRLTDSAHHQMPGSVSPDGHLLAFTELDPATGADIWTVAVNPGGGVAQPVVRTPFDEAEPAFSPDGRWLAYQGNESNRWEVYVRPFAGPGAAVPISAGGGTSPVWARDGRTLYYAGRSGVMAVAIACSASPSPPQSRASLSPFRSLGIQRASGTRRNASGAEAAGEPQRSAESLALRAPCDLAPSRPMEVTAARGAWIPRGAAPDGRLLVERARGHLAGVDRVTVTLQWTRELQRLLPPAVIGSPK